LEKSWTKEGETATKQKRKQLPTIQRTMRGRSELHHAPHCRFSNIKKDLQRYVTKERQFRVSRDRKPGANFNVTTGGMSSSKNAEGDRKHPLRVPPAKGGGGGAKNEQKCDPVKAPPRST